MKKTKTCKDCIYYKTCGDSKRTEPCKGKRTKAKNV